MSYEKERAEFLMRCSNLAYDQYCAWTAWKKDPVAPDWKKRVPGTKWLAGYEVVEQFTASQLTKKTRKTQSKPMRAATAALVGGLERRAKGKAGLGRSKAWLTKGAKALGYAVEQVPIGFALRKGEEAFFIFRGTQSTQENVLDWLGYPVPFIDAPLVRREIPRVSLGYYLQFLLAQGAIDKTIEAQREAKRFYYAGHSLGSTLAFLCGIHAKLSFRLGAEHRVYGFAAPLLGDPRFAGLCNKLDGAYSIVNYADSVPFMTLSDLGVTAAEWFPIGEQWAFLNQRGAGARSFGGDVAVSHENHSAEVYLDAVEQNAPRCAERDFPIPAVG